MQRRSFIKTSSAALVGAGSLGRPLEERRLLETYCPTLSLNAYSFNDVLLDGLKTSGILMEMHAEAARIDSLILGIGINLNVDRNTFPEEFRAGATSLGSALGRPVDRLPFTCRLFERLEEVLDIHTERGFDALRTRFDQLFHMTGHEVDVQEIGATRYAGTVLGIDADGALRLQRKDGRLCRVLAGDVTLSATDPSNPGQTPRGE